MITLVTCNGFGNQIWEYLLARHYAKLFNVKLKHGGQLSLPHLKQPWEQHCTLSDVFNVQWIDGRIIEGTAYVVRKPYSFDFTKFVNKPVIIRAFHSSIYQLPSLSTVKLWLPLIKPQPRIDKNTIHIRLKDHIDTNWARQNGKTYDSTLRFFHDKIQLLDLTKPTEIITDEPNHKIVKQISGFCKIPVVETTDWIEAWHKIYQATTVISFKSTFSWWAAKLGHAHTLIT